MIIAPIRRLSTLALLTPEELGILAEWCGRARLLRIGEVLSDDLAAKPLMVVSGWLSRARTTQNGARQLLDLMLPGDLITPGDHGGAPIAALSDARICIAPIASPSSGLAIAYTASSQLDRTYLLAQVARLGGMNAQGRLLHLISEIYERLLLGGQVVHGSFVMPLSQFSLGSLMGITAVHTNRMVQEARLSDAFRWNNGAITLPSHSEIRQRAEANVLSIRSREPKIERY